MSSLNNGDLHGFTEKKASADGTGGPLPSKIDGDSWFDRVFTMHFMTYGTYGFWFTLFTSFRFSAVPCRKNDGQPDSSCCALLHTFTTLRC